MCTVEDMCIGAELTFGFIQSVSICVQFRVCVLVPSWHLDLFRVCLYVYSKGYVHWCRFHIWIYSECVYMCAVQGTCISDKFSFGFIQGVYMCTVQGMCIGAEFPSGFIQDVSICVQYRVRALVPSSHLDLFRVCLYVYSTGYVYWCRVHIWIYPRCVYMCIVQGMCIDAEFPYGFIHGLSICAQYRVCVLVPSLHLDLFRVCLYVCSTGYVH